jgi:hypothetical protein
MAGKPIKGGKKMEINGFVQKLHQEQIERIKKDYPALDAELEGKISVHHGRKYIRVDVGLSGKYMIDQVGNIYGIKAYGVPHFGKRYGNLETIDQFYWGNYSAERK